MVAELEAEPPRDTPLLEAVEALAVEVLGTRRFTLPRFWSVMQAAGLGPQELFSTYVGKNVLNFFRQDHGYKDGRYQKNWQGREVNEHLAELMEGLDDRAPGYPERLYAALDERYRLLTGA